MARGKYTARQPIRAPSPRDHLARTSQTRQPALDREGNPIPPDRRAGVYVVAKQQAGWRIIALYGHDADKPLRLKNRVTTSSQVSRLPS
ncbi:MAG: hypothetical protein CMJ59_12625 [Planctomycetaceae bacterium]|nr:hypothetical protein [Planctomycetaceae bacterium]